MQSISFGVGSLAYQKGQQLKKTNKSDGNHLGSIKSHEQKNGKIKNN